jgi:hypothetical protein
MSLFESGLCLSSSVSAAGRNHAKQFVSPYESVDLHQVRKRLPMPWMWALALADPTCIPT